MTINSENYYSVKANQEYFSCSQFKAFARCGASALANLNDEITQEKSTALLVGSYVDAFYEGTLEKFKDENPEIFRKDGKLKAEYIKADEIIQKTTSDPMFAKYMSGQKQVIMTGTIADIPFKIKMDSYHEGKAIVDLKVIKDFKPIWENHRKLPFIEYWGYDIQGAIYQEIVRQNTGKTLPFFIAAATKEAVPDIALLSIGQDRLDECLNYVIDRLPEIKQIKDGKIPPTACGKCDYCRKNKVITEIIDYRDLEE